MDNVLFSFVLKISQKGLPLETKNTQNHENRLRRHSIFKITRMGSMILKEIKYNLHYDDVRGDFLKPSTETRGP